MLRKLLNNDEDKSFKKNQDLLIQQLLKTEGKVSVDMNNMQPGAPKLGGPSRLLNSTLDNMNSAHLAGQNPMLASMLAQTPRTAPTTVPTSVASAIVSQLPQERLPKNLEKNWCTHLILELQSVAPIPRQSDVVSWGCQQNVQLANYSDLLSNNSQQQASIQNTANLLIDGLAEASRDPNNVVSANDPLLSDILDQVWSMEQDMNMGSDDYAFFKLLEELPETTAPAAPAASPQPPSAHNVQEKLAIQSIQKQLMSFEVQPGPASTSRNSSRFQQQVVMTQPPLTSSSYSLVNQYQTAPPAYSTSNPVQRARAPGIPSIRRQQLLETQRHKLFLQQQFNHKKLLLQQKQQQQQQLALNALNNRQPMPDNIPNLQSPASSPYGENMNDLINNTVAPNVTLQRSTSMPEPQLSPRYSNVQQMPNSVAPPASPSQLSPWPAPATSFLPLSPSRVIPTTTLSHDCPLTCRPSQALIKPGFRELPKTKAKYAAAESHVKCTTFTAGIFCLIKQGLATSNSSSLVK
ncbi:nuclear receptor coactivator 2 [Caerostris extrusa]|uniref:Nuclear receptor coactivator 2 n=1 Tax=Caerostris extrusa TaxID=172846 RepID=A0AAV4XPN2_CAEEX|nr:nuclear receptor coactivator 2 [Caerostris extrusa]